MTHKQKVLALLRDGKPHTHHELYALGCVAHSRVADLRRDGHNIVCWSQISHGGRVSIYQLLPSLDDATGGLVTSPQVGPHSQAVPSSLVASSSEDTEQASGNVLALFSPNVPVDQPPLFAA